MSKKNDELNANFMEAVKADKDATSIYKQFRLMMAEGMTTATEKADGINYAKLFLAAQKEVERGGYRAQTDPKRREMDELSRDIFQADLEEVDGQ